jgi:hypothetical protein
MAFPERKKWRRQIRRIGNAQLKKFGEVQAGPLRRMRENVIG